MQISSLQLHFKQPLQEAYLNAFQLVKIRLVGNDGPDLKAIAQDWLHKRVKQFAFDDGIMEMQLLTATL